jgi:anti-sigma regulatory factor (Ser/Thr protein kinase)
MKGELMDRVVLQVPSDLRYGEALRSMVDTLSRRLEVETETAGLNTQIVSAFSEAFNNVVEHAYEGERTGTLEIRVELSSEEISLSFIDQGRSFDLDIVEAPDLEALPEGGLGIWIIRSFMTTVRGGREGDSNVLTMTKSFEKPLVMTNEPQKNL